MANHRILSVSVHPAGATTPAGLKRQVFHQALGGVDLLVGPNGAGKTTRGPLAITAALEGLATVPTDPRRPYVGPLPEATAVTLEVQTPSGVERLTRPLDAARGKAVATADQRARDLVGVPPTAWDLRDFATATGGGRASILDAVARAGGALERWGVVRAQQHVEALLLETAPENEHEAWCQPLRQLIGALDAAPDGATWLQAAETWTVARQQGTNAAQKDAKGHLDGVVQEATEPPQGDRAADEAAHRQLLQRQAALDRGAEELRTAEAARQRHTAEGERLRAALQATEAEGRRLAQPVAAEQLGEHTERLRVALAARQEPMPGPDHRAEEIEVEIASAQTALAEAMEAESARVKAQAEVAALASVSGGDAVCRHCHAADPLGIAADLQAARERLAALPVLASAPIRTRLRELEGRLATARGHEPAIRAERQREVESAQRELERAQQRVTRAEEQRARDLAAARQRWRDASAALKAWEDTPPPELPDVSDDARGEVAVALATAEARMAAWRAHDDMKRRTAQAAERYRAAKLTWDATRALLDAVRQARDDVAAAAYAPIHRAARELLADAADLPSPYFAGPDDFGADIQGRGRVPFAGLSESEQRITAAGLVYALATVAGCPCRLVLLDGLEVVQRDHRAPLVAALARAQRAGKVDSVVLTMATAPGEGLGDLEAVEGVTVHRIERAPHPGPVPVANQPGANRPDPQPEPVLAADGCPF